MSSSCSDSPIVNTFLSFSDSVIFCSRSQNTSWLPKDKDLKKNRLKVSRGTIVDAIITNAPSSTKSKNKERDPDMRQTRKGNQ